MTGNTFLSSRDVRWLPQRGVPLILILYVAFVVGCGSTHDLVNDEQKALVSLQSTVTTVGSAWLDGHVSTRYARTALEAAAGLLEKERARIGGAPDALADPAVASLSESENQLARQISLLRKALADSDAAAVRHVMATVASRQSPRP